MSRLPSMRSALLSLTLLAAVSFHLFGCEDDDGGAPTPALATHQITRSGTTIDCGGDTFNDGVPTEIQIKGPIKNTTIRNCIVFGSIRTIGLARTGEGRRLRTSSRRPGHTPRAQAAAPTATTLDTLIIHGLNSTPLYVGPGTTDLSLTNFRLSGASKISAIYLDAESARIRLEDGVIETVTPRESIAVDGSAFNKIRRLDLLTPDNGAVFLYRNCGEGGTIRHQTPSNNVVTDLTLHTLLPLSSLIRENSRNGNRSYCNDDAGYPFGSSADNNDNGTDNKIRRNRTVTPTR